MEKLSRRRLMQVAGLAGAVTALDAAGQASLGRGGQMHRPYRPPTSWDASKIGAPMMRDPIWVYDNWAAYAEGVEGLKDTRLTEELALKQLRQVVRFKGMGVHFDYYMMNAFWFAPDGAYREWRKPDWPNGPDQWIEGCLENGIKPGLWFGSNTLWQIHAAPQWRNSLAGERKEGWPLDSMSFYEGGFLSDFMSVVQRYYDRGVRMFEFDVANFEAATPAALKTQSPEEIRSRNQTAFSDALKAFRRANPDAVLVAFNDFGGDRNSTAGSFPFKNPVDLRWLEVFDTLYSGDTRASDVPQANFWRSVDLYNDHMVRRYEQSGVPLERIDPFFTLSTSWFGYSRGKQAWKGALLLACARGSWKKTIYGSLDLLDDADVRWFSRVQGMYAPLLAMGRTKTFGGIPGEVEPYGFGSLDIGGALYTVVNPTQEVRAIDLPVLSAAQTPLTEGRVLFRDAGFVPILEGTGISMGPGQMAVIGFGRYAASEYELGVQEDVVIPRRIQPVQAEFRHAGPNVIEATVTAPAAGDLRIVFEQRLANGAVLKSKRWGKIEVRQQGKDIPVESDLTGEEDGFGGISWSAGEVRRKALTGVGPVTIRYSLPADEPAMLKGYLYSVEY